MSPGGQFFMSPDNRSSEHGVPGVHPARKVLRNVRVRVAPRDGRNDLELAGATVRAVLHVDIEGASFILHLLQWDCPRGLE